jgi:antagonist of KipI
MADILVIKPGMLTTVQDLGRWGLQARGVPVAGPMDPWSHRLANALVGNDRAAATLEITLLGPELEFEDERLAAVAGAEFEIVVDGRPAPWNTPFLIPGGSRLRFGRREQGVRAYLAIAGGIAVPPVLGSRATHVVSGLGGLAGRPLRAEDRLPLGDEASARGPAPALDGPMIPFPAGDATVRVLPGPQ